MGGLNVVQILGLGVSGFGFLMAYLAYRLLDRAQTRPNPSKSTIVAIGAYMVFAIVLCSFGLVAQMYDQKKAIEVLQARLEGFQARDRLPSFLGKITTPSQGSTVGKTYDAAGLLTYSVKGAKFTGVHFWLATEVDGYFWPKEREVVISEDGKWTATVFENGKSTSFSLDLIATDDDGNSKIQEWLKRGRETNIYDRMQLAEGMQRLAAVDGLRINIPAAK